VWNHRDFGTFGLTSTEKSGDFDGRRANVPANRLFGNPRPNGEQLSSTTLVINHDDGFELRRIAMGKARSLSPLGNRDCKGYVQLIT